MFSITPISGCPSLRDHLRGALGDALCGELRRGHEHGLGMRQQLPEREADVAGPRRHVDQEVVQRAPVDVGEELLERAVQHRAAPHDRAAVIQEEPDGHHLQVVRHGRHDHLVDHDRALLDAEHARDRVAVDVCVDDPDLEAPGAQCEREVHRQRRLADAALAGGDGDDARALVDGDLPLAVLSGRPEVARATPPAARSSMCVKPIVTLSTPGTAPTCIRTCASRFDLSGQPGIVSRIVTCDVPPSTSTASTMPSSTTLRRISGSMTSASALWSASEAGTVTAAC